MKMNIRYFQFENEPKTCLIECCGAELNKSESQTSRKYDLLLVQPADLYVFDFKALEQTCSLCLIDFMKFYLGAKPLGKTVTAINASGAFDKLFSKYPMLTDRCVFSDFSEALFAKPEFEGIFSSKAFFTETSTYLERVFSEMLGLHIESAQKWAEGEWTRENFDFFRKNLISESVEVVYKEKCGTLFFLFDKELIQFLCDGLTDNNDDRLQLNRNFGKDIMNTTLYALRNLLKRQNVEIHQNQTSNTESKVDSKTNLAPDLRFIQEYVTANGNFGLAFDPWPKTSQGVS